MQSFSVEAKQRWAIRVPTRNALWDGYQEMLNALYSGAAAVDVLTRQQEVIASNLMHVNTAGHRRVQSSTAQRFEPDHFYGLVDLGPEEDKTQADFSLGRLEPTTRALDFAIQGDGFFVYGEEGSEFYSRDGRLYRDPETNFLVDGDGNRLQGTEGPIAIEADIGEQEIIVSSDGRITARGQEVGTIRAVAFEDNRKLISDGPIRFRQGPDSVVSDKTVNIAQFQRELSNVQPINELISLIVNNRQFEAVQKATRTLSEALQEYIRD